MRKITGTILTRGETEDNINFANKKEVSYEVELMEMEEVEESVVTIKGVQFTRDQLTKIVEDMEYLEGAE